MAVMAEADVPPCGAEWNVAAGEGAVRRPLRARRTPHSVESAHGRLVRVLQREGADRRRALPQT
ncbi:hypothetical protein GCM10010498_53330 [Streptomyces cavourensis]|nr:hypothetical protein GCM10010498_53330 [Streptomyces cavourensis]